MNERTIWEGQSQTLTGAATGGRGAVKYRLTNLFLYIEKGILRTDAQQVPIAEVGDVDIKASMTQKARRVGDVLVHVQRPGGVEVITIQAIPKPKDVQRMVNDTAHQGRAALLQTASTHTYRGRTPAQGVHTAAPAAPAAAIELIRELGELRDAGILSADEFTTKKEDILSRM